MKILEVGRQFIRRSTQILQDKICNFGTKRKYLPPEIKIKEQPISDTFDGRINLRFLEEGPYINEGRSAIVYQVKNNPDLVIRIKFGHRFKPEKLSFKNADPVRHIIAATDDFQVTVMKKMKGYPLHGECWHIMDDPNPAMYFEQIKALKDIPDETFIKYANDILEIREKGYNVDTTNPNNILFDNEAQKFNIVDIEKIPVEKEVVIDDFYPFIDGARLLRFYTIATDETRELIQKEARLFLDRIAKIGNKMGVDLSMRKFNDDDIIPQFMTCLYHNKRLDLYQHRL